MLLWYDEETNKEYEVKIAKNTEQVLALDPKWRGQSQPNEFGLQVMIWRAGEEVYMTIFRDPVYMLKERREH